MYEIYFTLFYMMYPFNSTEWCYIKRTTDNVLQITVGYKRDVSVKGENGKYDFANTTKKS
jgi:hypothetical protein